MPLSFLVSSLFVAAAAAAVVPGPDLKYDLSLIDTNKMNISAAPTRLDVKPDGVTSSWVYYSQCDSQVGLRDIHPQLLTSRMIRSTTQYLKQIIERTSKYKKRGGWLDRIYRKEYRDLGGCCDD